VTDALLAGVELAEQEKVSAAVALLDRQWARHRDIAQSLLSEERRDFEQLLAAARDELGECLQVAARRLKPRPCVRDAVASFGERLSAALLAAALRAIGLPATYADARRCIVTDDHYGNAQPLGAQCERQLRAELGPLLASARIPVLGGFIGATVGGETTTLGRNGSDYTSTQVGGALRAREIQIWTDVAGVMTTDPRVVPRARTVERLSYAEAATLAHFGAKVIYPQAVEPAAEAGIPLRVLNSYAPEAAGTLVGLSDDQPAGIVKAIAHKGGCSIVRVGAARAAGAGGFMTALRGILRQEQLGLDSLAISETGATLAVSEDGVAPRVLDALSEIGRVNTEQGRAIICLVGEGLLCNAAVTASVLDALDSINVAVVAHGPSRHSLLFAVPEDQARAAVTHLHDLFF
jgi:aspartate kinase